MSWHFSRALVEEYSAASSSDGARSALSSGSPTPPLFLPSDRMTAFSRLSRFGMTFGHLTDDLGEELLTWFRAGFPAKISPSPDEGGGIEGLRSGLWKEMWRIIGEVRPGIVWVENSAALTYRGLGVVLGDLAELGYDARWGVVSASNAGMAHERERIWILAYASEDGLEGVLAGDHGTEGEWREQTERGEDWNVHEMGEAGHAILAQRKDQPPTPELADGVASWVDQLEALGNGQVPRVVRLAFRALR